MKKIYFLLIQLISLNLLTNQVMSQSLPVGELGLEDYYRSKQLLGELDPAVSFSIRPIFPSLSFKINNIYDPDSTLSRDGFFKKSGPVRFANGKGEFQILPFSWKQQDNSDHPYGWNDGAMIPARGYQTMISGGFFARFGPLSIQLRPEFVYAQNRDFDGFAKGKSDLELTQYYEFYNLIDAPERFGTGVYKKVFWGQSNIRLTVGPASLGLSNENLWWGPGRNNSIMMTNNSAGFKHFTLNTVKPIKTFIGSFEAQIIAGKLENSNYTPLTQTNTSTGLPLFSPYKNDWRYLTGFNINYQPRWIPGLFIGFTRDFMSYHEDLNGIKDYFPFFTPVQKINTGLDGDPFDRDQRLSMYARWLFPKAHAEVYFEYGLNDNSYNLRDFAGSPDHSRAYVFGFNKLVPLKGTIHQFLQIAAEITQTSESLDRIIRGAGGFYQHSGVKQGYTNLGQVIGAGIGTGGNIQSLDISWVNKLKYIGVSFERYEHNKDFYNRIIGDANGQDNRNWVDFAIAAKGGWNYKNLLFSAKIQGIKSLNYQWLMKGFTIDRYYIPHNDVFNFHGELGVSFRF